MSDSGAVHEETEATIREEASRIADEVRDARFEMPDGTTGWLGYDMNFPDEPKGRIFLRNQTGITNGQVGVGLFFAAMDAVLEESYSQDAREAVDFLLEADLADLTADLALGVDDGVGGLAYGLAAMAELTGDDEYEDRALALVGTITDQRIAADGEYDLLHGAAGEILGLLGLYERTGEDEVLARAVDCGEHLLAERIDKLGYRVWDTHWDETAASFSTGISHGGAGMALALYRLSDHTGREAFREAADEAVAFENVFYSERQRNWKSNWSSIPTYPRWWAYGAPGIGLARIGSLQYHDADPLRRDVERVAGAEPALTPKDSLMRGTFAQVDLLVELGRTHDGTDAGRAADLATDAIDRKGRRGGYQVVGGSTPGATNAALFYGEAGIGYTFARVLAPEVVPSVLRFE